MKYLIPNAANPGSEIYYYGRQRVDSSNDVDFIKIGQERCDSSDQNEFEPITFSPHSDQGAPCNIPKLEAGYYNVSQRNKENTGLAQKLNTVPTYRLDGDAYDFSVVPQISSISNNVGSSQGQILTIQGSGFSTSGDNQVNLADTSCEILSQSSTEIKCELGARSTSIPTQGYHSGLKLEVYPGKSLASVKAGTAGTPSTVQSNLVFELPFGLGTSFSSKLSGYFKAPVTGSYKFIVSADDKAQLYISSTPLSTSNLDLLVDIATNTPYKFFFTNGISQISDDVFLTADQYYYMELYHQQGSGSEFATVGVQIPGTPNTVNVRPEAQSVKINCPVDYEIIEFTIANAVSGNWRIRFDYVSADGKKIEKSVRTGNLTLDSTGAQIASAITAAMGIGSQVEITMYDIDYNVTLDASSAFVFVYNVTFTNLRKNGVLPAIESTDLIGSDIDTTVIQLQEPSPALGGTFTITRSGQTAEFGPATQTWDFESNLRKVGFADPIQVTRYGDTDLGAQWNIQFDGDGSANIDPLIIANSLTGCRNPAEITIDVTTLQDSSDDLYYYTIPTEFLFTADTTPQITLTSNGIRGNCPGFNCGYTLQTANLPEISAASFSAPTLTLTVANADAYGVADLQVFLGNTECQVQSFASSVVTASCSTPEAGSFIPRLHLKDLGFASVSAGVSALNIPLTISSVSPSQVNPNGGTVLTVSGSGFPASLQVAQTRGLALAIGTGSCTPSAVSPTQVICVSTAVSAAAPLTATLNGNTGSSSSLSLLANPPTISSITPNSVNPVLQTDITIVGTDFDSNTAQTKVILRNTADSSKTSECLVYGSTTTQITCKLLGAPTGTYNFFVQTSKGHSNTQSFTVQTVITGVSPSTGSLAGGTILTIQGGAFSTDVKQSLVFIGDGNIACDVIASTTSQVQCRTRALTNTAISGVSQTVYVDTRIVEEAVCQDATNNCQFTYSSSATPVVTAFSAATVIAGDSLSVTGSGLESSPAGTTPIVIVDGVACTVTSSSDTEITFTVPASITPNKEAVVIVYVPGKGYPQFDASISSNISVTPGLSSSSPATGSLGGVLLTVKGVGFKTGASILVGSTPCQIQSLTSDTIVCKATSSGEVSLSYNDITDIKCSSSCSLSLLPAITPTVTSATYTSAVADLSITFTFVGTQLNLATPVVTFRSQIYPDLAYSVTPTTVSATTIVATVKSLPMGPYDYEILYDGLNFAQGSRPFYGITAKATKAAVTSSIAGGVVSTLTGYGFSPVASQNQVFVCGLPGEVISSTPTTIQYKTPMYVSPAVLAAYPRLVKPSTLTPARPWSDSGSESVVFDGTLTTSYVSNNNDCYIGFTLTANQQAQITEIQFYPDPATDPSLLNGTVIEAATSNSSASYTPLYTIDVNAHDAWNTIPLENAGFYTYFRVRGTSSNGKCAFAEIRYIGYLASTVTTAPTLDSISCAVRLQVANVSLATVDGPAAAYKQSRTPNVTSIQPSKGTYAGGTPIVLSGANFGTTAANVAVYIDNVKCTVTAATDTQISCTTGPAPPIGQRTTSQEGNVRVEVSDRGYAIVNNLQYLYVERWSEDNTWGGISPPREGDSVSIPAGQAVLLDISPPKLKAIIVEGALIFDDANINLDCEYIMVNGGRLQIGTPDEPIQNKITVTLYGTKESPTLPIYGNKVIAIMEGLLDIHGTPRSHTWTVLDSTAAIGDTSIVVQGAVDWVAGEQIVIASTDHDHYQSESRTIASVAKNSPSSGLTTITFDDALVNRHYADIQGIEDQVFEMRAEVGLLTRNVVIQGDDQSQKLQYGAHIMAHGHSGDDSSIVRISYTEVRQAGQAYNMARYPIHLHLIGNVRESYVLGNAIHHTYNRAVTIHGVHYLRVQKNFAYWVMGHTIFIEDGIETHNVIEDNLVINTMASTSLLETDQTPACFWITNPNNIWRRNHAAGSDRYGFWFDLREHPQGPSATDSICPIGERLGEFTDNQAHSSGRYGLRVFHELVPRTYPCLPIQPYEENPPVPAQFTNFLGWKNMRNGVIGERLGAIKFKNIKTADNLRAGIEISFGDLSPPDTLLVEDAWIVGTTPENGDDLSKYTDRIVKGLITPRVDNFLARNVHFSNFASGMTAIETCSHCEHPASTDAGARTSFFEGLTFNNVVQRVRFNAPYKEILIDRDGSLTDNTVGGKGVVTFFYNHLNVPGCTRNEPVYNGLVCDETQMVRKVELLNLDPFASFEMQNLELDNLENTQDTGLGSIPYRSMRQSWAVPFVTGYSYQLSWRSRADFNALTVSPSALYSTTDKSITLVFNHSDYRETYDVFRASPFTNVSNTTTLWDAVGANSKKSGDWYHDVDNQLLYLAVNGKQKTDLNVKAVKCRVNCPIVSAPVPKDGIIRLWSNATQWPGEVVPQAGDNVIIPGEWTIKLDVSTASLGTLEVRGDLYFDETQDNLVLTAQRIWVTGQLFIGNSTTERYTNQAKILLTGKRNSKALVLGPVQDAGNKVLAVTGNLTMYGALVNNVYVRLQAPANVGDTTITVPSTIDWKVGDLIVIAPSQRIETQYETRTIQAISNGVITLDKALKYYHYGAASFTTLDMRTEVALLSRNIKVEGSDEDSWGGRIYVGEVYNSTFDHYYRGRIDLDGVEGINLGQANTTFAGITFDALTTANNGDSSVTRSVLRNSLGYSVSIVKSAGVIFDSNVMFLSYRYQVRFDGQSSYITYTNNLNIGNRDRGIKADVADHAVDFTAMIYADSLLISSTVSNNILVGCEKNCLVSKGGKCSSQTTGPYTFANNVAHSGETGWLADAPDAVCNGITHFTGYKLEIGVVTYFKSQNIQASNLLISDTEIGVTLNTGAITDDTTITLRDSHLIGLGLVSDPSAYWNKTECNGLVGTYISVSTVGAKSIPPTSSQLPWYKVKSDHIWKATYTITGVTFENFDDSLVSGCSANRAINTNPYASDSSAATKLSNINHINVANTNRIFFANPDDAWIGLDDCGGWYCTGPKNIIVQDLDGSLFGQIASIIPLNKGVYNSRCSVSLAENAYICAEVGWGVLTFESLDADALTRILSPINVTNADGYRNDINNYMDHLWDGFYTSLKRLSRYHSIVETAKDYLVKFTSTVPNALRWQLEGANSPSDWVTAQYRYTTPQSVKVTDNDGNTINPKYIQSAGETTGIAESDTCGANVYIVADRKLTLKLTGEDTCRIQVKLINAIQASIRYSVTIEEFFALDGPTAFIDRVAAILNINPASIRITEIRSGSTIINFDLEADYQEDTSESDKAAKEQLNGWVTVLTDSVSNNDLSLFGSKILNSSFKTNLIRGDEDSTSESHSNKKKTVIIVASSVGFVALAIGSFFMYKRHVAARNSKAKVHTEKQVRKFDSEFKGLKAQGLFINTEGPTSKMGFDVSRSQMLEHSPGQPLSTLPDMNGSPADSPLPLKYDHDNTQKPSILLRPVSGGSENLESPNVTSRGLLRSRQSRKTAAAGKKDMEKLDEIIFQN